MENDNQESNFTIHKLTKEERDRATNSDEYRCNEARKYDIDKYGTVYSSYNASDINLELEYRENTLNIFDHAYNIFLENHNNLEFDFTYKTKTVEENLKFSFSQDKIPHILGFDDEKIFSKSRAAENKLKLLFKDCESFDIEEYYSKGSDTINKMRMFNENKVTLIENELDKYLKGEIAAFNYAKIYTKLSTYVNYENMQDGYTYVVSEVNKDKDKKNDVTYGQKFIYSLVRLIDEKNEEIYPICQLKLIKEENDKYIPYSLVRLSGSEKPFKIIFDNYVPKHEEKTKEKSDFSFELGDVSMNENDLKNFNNKSNKRFNDFIRFSKLNKDNTFVFLDHSELITFLTKIEMLAVSYHNADQVTRKATKEYYYNLIDAVSAIDLEESIDITADDVKRIKNLVLEREKYKIADQIEAKILKDLLTEKYYTYLSKEKGLFFHKTERSFIYKRIGIISVCGKKVNIKRNLVSKQKSNLILTNRNVTKINNEISNQLLNGYGSNNTGLQKVKKKNSRFEA